ncbi:hypothetical protein KCP71_19820 [Salmonella enterica subsp. enterica]|nr:hypothetical protein KCP71_19820 [Salmonella enterica subsp. enterica]
MLAGPAEDCLRRRQPVLRQASCRWLLKRHAGSFDNLIRHRPPAQYA